MLENSCIKSLLRFNLFWKKKWLKNQPVYRASGRTRCRYGWLPKNGFTIWNIANVNVVWKILQRLKSPVNFMSSRCYCIYFAKFLFEPYRCSLKCIGYFVISPEMNERKVKVFLKYSYTSFPLLASPKCYSL